MKLRVWLRLMRTTPAGWLSMMAMVTAVFTYIVLTQVDSPLLQDTRRVVLLISANVALLLALCVVVFRQMASLWRDVRVRNASSRLRRRIVLAFTIGAVVPGLLVTFFAGYLFYFGLHSWFDSKIATALDESTAVAEAYLSEHLQTIKADALAMASDIAREAPFLIQNQAVFNQFISTQASHRSLTEAVVFQPDRMIARSQLSFSFTFERLPMHVLRQADTGEVVVIGDDDDRVRAILRLREPINAYLLVGRFVDPRVLGHLERTRGAVSEYKRLQEQVLDLQWNVLAVFVLLTLLLLMLALWYALIFARRLVEPLGELANASERVGAGDLTARVPPLGRKDELAALGQAFNRMTQQLETQREELMTAQRSAAWADVARRIAHEIKNPLTPIQLAAERLRRKYGKNLEGEDKETFSKYVDTILRHVGDIGSIVEEFVSFARMPTPVIEPKDLCALAREAVFSEQGRMETVKLQLELPEAAVMAHCDAGQIGRLLTNTLKNAAEALEGAKIPSPTITLRVQKTSKNAILTIEDNGPGFPKELLPRLTEPYVTTRTKGTGLGLAIVKKIVEEHGGELKLENRNEGGARVEIYLPLNK